MLVQESNLGETLYSKDMNDTIDESEETLSLCDLPLYSDQSADWDHQDLSLASNSMSSYQEECFEFFSQELNPSTTTTTDTATGFPPENIIFCGKLIPYKQLATCHERDSSNLDEIKNQKKNKKKGGWRLFRWKFSSKKSSKRQQVLSKNGTRSTTPLMQQSPKRMYNTNKLGKGHGFPTHRMSIVTSSSSGKAKWHLLFFGISRISSEVHMGDIKSRQSRRYCRSPPPSSPPPMFGFQNHDDDVVSDRGWGLWGLIRALSCGGNHQSTSRATASMGGCTPPE